MVRTRQPSLEKVPYDDIVTGRRVKNIGFVLFTGVEELDLAGPWEVVKWWTAAFPQDGYRAFCISADGNPVTARLGLSLGAHHSFSTMPKLDVLVHPGGTVGPLMADPTHLAWLQAQRATVPLLTSVCNGALVFAAAGLLAHRQATTYAPAMAALQNAEPTVTVHPNERFVDDGDIITSAGVSAGIDMALYLIKRLSSLARAQQVRTLVEYDPQPPV